jgi:hypothetical protein
MNEKFTHPYLIQNHCQRLDEITINACFEQLKRIQKVQNSKKEKEKRNERGKPIDSSQQRKHPCKRTVFLLFPWTELFPFYEILSAEPTIAKKE